MRVAHVINGMATGGAEKLLADIIPRLEARDIQVDLLLLNGKSHPLKMQLADKMTGSIVSLGENSVYSPFHIFRLRKHLKKYDLVHVHLFPALYWVALCKFLFNIPVTLVFTEHSTSNRRFRQNWTKVIDAFIYNRYSKIVSISERINAFITHRFSLDTVLTIPNGIDISAYQGAEAYSIPEMTDIFGSYTIPRKWVIQVSSFQEPKDQTTVAQSLSYLPQDVFVAFVGTGPLLQKSKDSIHQLGISHRVAFLGVRTDVPRLLKSADIVVLSSKYEGMSLSSIEGMASGRPFVATDVPGLSEIVGGAGVLFPQGDAKKLAKEINRLLDDQEYYTSVVEKCQERASAYDISTMVSKHINLYQSLA
tara:strand:+ start:5159 stop:6250 length:1092 start_codon:yes stop_codon:yes gene_type:complete